MHDFKLKYEKSQQSKQFGHCGTGTALINTGTDLVLDSCHSRVIQNQQNLYPKFPPTTVVKLLQYSDSRVELRDGFSSYK